MVCIKTSRKVKWNLSDLSGFPKRQLLVLTDTKLKYRQKEWMHLASFYLLDPMLFCLLDIIKHLLGTVLLPQKLFFWPDLNFKSQHFPRSQKRTLNFVFPKEVKLEWGYRQSRGTFHNSKGVPTLACWLNSKLANYILSPKCFLWFQLKKLLITSYPEKC